MGNDPIGGIDDEDGASGIAAFSRRKRTALRSTRAKTIASIWGAAPREPRISVSIRESSASEMPPFLESRRAM
jgi:hypothetical protein